MQVFEQVDKMGRSGHRAVAWLVTMLLLGCSADSTTKRERTGTDAAPSSIAPEDTVQPGGQDQSPNFGNGPASTAGTAGSPAPGPATTMPPEDTCAEGQARATPVTPTVWLVVDGSSSMTQSFDGGANRWQVLRSTLMDPGGIVDSLQGVVRFGMVIYSGGEDGLLGVGGSACPNLVTVDPALDNHATLDAQYPAMPIGTGTPTHMAVQHVVDELPVLNEQVLDQDADPVYVVLATDGGPNDPCSGAGFGAGAEQQVLDIVGVGTERGMNMFVISLAGGDAALQTHLDQVAQITKTGTPPFVPSTQDELVQTFQDIVGGATCLVSLDGEVSPGRECGGTVTLNGEPIACNDPDGWKLEDPRTVQLEGASCERFKASESMLMASFPCDVFRPD